MGGIVRMVGKTRPNISWGGYRHDKSGHKLFVEVVYELSKGNESDLGATVLADSRGINDREVVQQLEESFRIAEESVWGRQELEDVREALFDERIAIAMFYGLSLFWSRCLLPEEKPIFDVSVVLLTVLTLLLIVIYKGLKRTL